MILDADTHCPAHISGAALVRCMLLTGTLANTLALCFSSERKQCDARSQGGRHLNRLVADVGVRIQARWPAALVAAREGGARRAIFLLLVLYGQETSNAYSVTSSNSGTGSGTHK